MMPRSGASKTVVEQPRNPRGVEAQLWLAVMDFHGDLFVRLNQALGKEFGLTLAKFDVLAQLYRFRQGLTQVLLSRHLKVTGGNITGLVRRLAADKLITREISSEDRRAVVVRATPKGIALYCAARQHHDALLQQWFEQISKEDLRDALTSLSSVSSRLDPDRRESKI